MASAFDGDRIGALKMLRVWVRRSATLPRRGAGRHAQPDTGSALLKGFHDTATAERVADHDRRGTGPHPPSARVLAAGPRAPRSCWRLVRQLLRRVDDVFSSSRSVIYTGRHVPVTEIYDNDNMPYIRPLDPELGTLGSMMRSRGYYTALPGQVAPVERLRRPSDATLDRRRPGALRVLRLERLGRHRRRCVGRP